MLLDGELLNMGDNITLLVGETYLVIDALYTNDLSQKLDSLKSENWYEDARKQIFPYVAAPFAVYVADSEFFTLDQIQSINYSKDLSPDKTVFVSDTDTVLFLDIRFLIEFLENFDYNELTDSLTDLFNVEYWNTLYLAYPPGAVGLLYSNAPESAVGLNGSGVYRIIKGKI